jgi:hypothetical protein
MGWVVSVTPPSALYPRRKDTLVPIVHEAGWAPEPVWTQRLEEKFFASAGDRTPIARSSSSKWRISRSHIYFLPYGLHDGGGTSFHFSDILCISLLDSIRIQRYSWFIGPWRRMTVNLTGSETARPMGALLVVWGTYLERNMGARQNIYFVRHFAWLKYFTCHLVPTLAPNCKQHVLSPATVSFVSVSQHAD